ncbi:MAG: DHH family phosphoesterase [Pseudomonadota bacterium]
MADFDVFNGDADGICALLQLRLAEPRTAELVTGVKRDIQLLERLIPGASERITVLDISLDKNREPLEALLAAGADVFYCDHHYAGEIPAAAGLDALINTAPDVCTSLLVNGRLRGAHAAWAVVGAFGDNLDNSARAAARAAGLSEASTELCQRLGIYINYNGYGAALEDLHFHPAELYQLLRSYPDPESFVAEAATTFERLEAGYQGDMARAEGLEPHWEGDDAALFVLPDAPWSRRVGGVYGNALARAHPARAHAVLTQKTGGFLVSVRAPLEDKRDADTLCRRFETGGGRAAAAGINHLPEQDLDTFIAALADIYAS